MKLQALTKTNRKHYIQTILDAIYKEGHTADPIWLPLTPKDITNKEVFGRFPSAEVRIIPAAEYKTAKEIRATWTKIALNTLVYRYDPEPIAFSVQYPLRDCLYQINRLFNTCFHPEERNVGLEIISKDKIKLSILTDDHPFFYKGDLILPAVDVSLMLSEMVNGSEVTLNKEDCAFALNLYSRKTSGRKNVKYSWNAYDALGLAIALRTYQKNGTRDGLNEYALESLPPHHQLTVRNGIIYGDNNVVPYVPTVAETESTNATTTLRYRPGQDNFPATSNNLIVVHYSRIDIRDYLREYFNASLDYAKLQVMIPGVDNNVPDIDLVQKLKEYLNFNTDEVVDRGGRRYNQDILVERQADGVLFDFRQHPLLFGTIKVDFNHV